MASVLPGMPEYLATNFSGDGAAAGWMSHGVFAAFSVGIWLVVVVSFWSARRALRRSSHEAPLDSWIGPSRIGEASRAIGGAAEGMGIATLVAALAMLEVLYRVNAMPEPRLPPGQFIPALVAYMTVLAFLGFRTQRTVLRLKREAAASPR